MAKCHLSHQQQAWCCYMINWERRNLIGQKVRPTTFRASLKGPTPFFFFIINVVSVSFSDGNVKTVWWICKTFSAQKILSVALKSRWWCLLLFFYYPSCKLTLWQNSTAPQSVKKKNAAKHHFSFLLKHELVTKCAVRHSHTWRRHPTPPHRSSLSLLWASHSCRLETQLPVNIKQGQTPPLPPPRWRRLISLLRINNPVHVRRTGGLGRSYTFSPYITTQLSDPTITAAGDPAIIPWWTRTSANGENNGWLRAIMSWLCYLFLWVWSAHEFRL